MIKNNRFIVFFMIMIIAISSAFSVCMPVYAADHGGSGSSDHVIVKDKTKVKKFIHDYFTNVADFWLYAAMQIGAVFVEGFDFATFAENYKAMDDIIDEEKDLGIYIDSDENVTGLYLSKEFMAQLKALLDEYAKTEQTKEENGGFYLLPTINFNDVPASNFPTGQAYRTFKYIVAEKGVLSVRTNYNGRMHFSDPFSDPDHPIALVGNATSLNNYINNPDAIVSCTYFCLNEWMTHSYGIMQFPEQDQIYTSCSEAEIINTGTSGYYNGTRVNSTHQIENYSTRTNFNLYSTTGERLRVFVSSVAAQNYSVGTRKVYYTNNYYNYEPEDLTVAVDDLQKSVDDLQKIIDELLKKINDQTSESEIEELLRLILEELQKNPGNGSGSGSGGGDVTVSVDLSSTNNWLSKIYAKVSEISEKISGFAGQSMDEVVDGIENLKKMLEKYLKIITSDLGDIKDQLEDMSEEEFNDKTDSLLDSTTESFSEVAELARTKFPFSIPNDMKNFLSVLAQTSPEAAGLYSVESSDISLYSGEHGGGGASRPGSDGFVYVENGEHGGGGVSREPSELVNGAPVFALPIVIERYGIEEYVIIDMAPFESVSKLSRSLFTMMFMLCLFNLTFKVMGLWGDLVG